MRFSLEFLQVPHSRPLKNAAPKGCCCRALRIQTDFKLKHLPSQWAKNTGYTHLTGF